MATLAKELRVLNFHGVGAPGRTLEPGEADYWIGADRFRDTLDRVAGHPDRGRLCVTFDDGNISDLLIAVPELQRRGLTAAFFVLTGRIGKPGSLGSDDIRALMRAGMRIGSHGVAHSDWASLSAKELGDEVTLSKAILGEICGEPVRSAAIPFGRYNAAVLAALRKAGYTAAYSSDGGSMETSAFLRPRTSIRRDTTDPALEAILSGRASAWTRVRRRTATTIKKWV
jgi:peptidoglycan/xylan/chitin deacetylase (PgdA/CDA1 family)